MSGEVAIGTSLQKRVTRLALLFAALMLANAALNISFMRSRHARDGRVANENLQIDSRIEDAKKIVEETHDLLRHANELNERAARIEASLDASKAKK